MYKEDHMNAVIKTENLCKDFTAGDAVVHVLKNLNIEIAGGEFISIMGPSGSGKSTLLYLLGALDKPTSGKIFVKNKELAAMTEKQQSGYRRTDLGFVFQFYNLVPNLSARENIMLPLLLAGKKLKDNREKLQEIAALVGLSDRLDHLPSQLSGGQQQRVAIARALIHEPEIILADEPVGNLDSKAGAEIMELFRRINREKGKTIVQVTHSPEAAAVGNRIILLKDGQI